MRERDFGKRERDIGDGKGTKGDHRTQGINDKKSLGTKRGGGYNSGEPTRAKKRKQEEQRRNKNGVSMDDTRKTNGDKQGQQRKQGDREKGKY